MSKHAKRSPLSARLAQLKRYPVLVLFFGFLLVMFAADCLTPYRARSELENKTFTQRPSITLADLTGSRAVNTLNDFCADYTDFFKEQLAGRDAWIDLYSRCETLLMQKQEHGGILLGSEGMEFVRAFNVTDTEQTYLAKNAAAITALGQRYPGLVYTMVVPSAAAVYPENLPLAAPQVDENALLDELLAQLAPYTTVVDVRTSLTAHKDEYIYYRTDHHWTTDGAYYAYAQLCDTLGLSPFDRAAHTAQTVENFYGTSYSKCRQWNAVPDTITYYPLDSQLTIYRVTGASTAEVDQVTDLYDTDKFAVYDKYAAFLHGNNGLSRLSGSGQGNILVVKDSYANCFVPYLTDNYANVDVVDLRNYNYGLDGLISSGDYDAVLVLYSYAALKTDPYLYRVGVAG